jgi:hypothetical protein
MQIKQRLAHFYVVDIIFPHIVAQNAALVVDKIIHHLYYKIKILLFFGGVMYIQKGLQYASAFISPPGFARPYRLPDVPGFNGCV